MTFFSFCCSGETLTDEAEFDPCKDLSLSDVASNQAFQTDQERKGIEVFIGITSFLRELLRSAVGVLFQWQDSVPMAGQCSNGRIRKCSNGRILFQWQDTVSMAGKYSNGRKVFQWQDTIPMAGYYSNGRKVFQ